jgi:hypothetical protein
VVERRSRFPVGLLGGLVALGLGAGPAGAGVPVVVVTNPPDEPGLAYVLGETVVPAFTCTDPDGDLPPAGCVADGPVDTTALATGAMFSVTATDDAGETTTVTRTYDVVDLPTCTDPSAASTTSPAPVSLGLDCDGLYDAIEVVDPPRHGTVTIDGTLATYLPAAGFDGDDAFTFRAIHGDAGADPASATVHVAPRSIPPGDGPPGGGGGADPSDVVAPPPAGLGVDDSSSAPPTADLPPIPFLPSLFGGAGAGGGNLPTFGRTSGVTATRAVRSGRVLVALRNANAFAVTARLALRGAGPTLTRDVTLTAATTLSITLTPRPAKRARTARLTLTVHDPAGAVRTAAWRLRLPARR